MRKQDVVTAQAESEATRDVPLPEDVKGQRRGRSIVQSVWLPEDAYADIERIANDAGVPVSALIRGWVLTALAREHDTSTHDGLRVRHAGRARHVAG